METYETVFEVTEKGLHALTFSPLLFFFVGAGIVWFNIAHNKKGEKRNFNIFGGGVMAVLGLVAFGFVLYANVTEKNRIHAIYHKQAYKVIAGKIENFQPMTTGGRGRRESFTVRGIEFRYADSNIVLGYNKTSIKGGFLRKNGQSVRLSYIDIDEDDRLILKVELKQE